LKVESVDAVGTSDGRQTVPRRRTGNAECTVGKVKYGTGDDEVSAGR